MYPDQYYQTPNMQQQIQQLLQQNQHLSQQNQHLSQQNRHLVQQNQHLVQQDHIRRQQVENLTLGLSNSSESYNELAQNFENLKKSEDNYRKRMVESAQKLNDNVENTNLLKKDLDGLVSLLSTIVPAKSVNIFCTTKQNCENMCNLISNLFPKNVREYRAAEREAIIEQIRDENDDRVCKVLANGFLNGIAYHHSGLTTDERQHVEHGFQTGVICVICCTSTLAAGVNLPARRVIIKSPYVGRDLISKAQYLQMVGRFIDEIYNNEIYN